MRIQHNIMAMNAYRNYNNNTSALSKNLEKLSSGYKINRAGDDAAGLAISEKMRAQITGLKSASKNVKDGVSLVKTAEGALQEVHDMLNRMDSLATQSANGTYDNEVDRANLQKEVTALKSEIDRIADSSNFNGIKLLDGSLSAAGAATGAGAANPVSLNTELNNKELTVKDVAATKGSYALGTALPADLKDGESLKLSFSLSDGTVKDVQLTVKKYTDGTDGGELIGADGTVYGKYAGAAGAAPTAKEMGEAFVKALKDSDLAKDFKFTEDGGGKLTLNNITAGADAPQVMQNVNVQKIAKDGSVTESTNAVTQTKGEDAYQTIDADQFKEYDGTDKTVLNINGKKFAVLVQDGTAATDELMKKAKEAGLELVMVSDNEGTDVTKKGDGNLHLNAGDAEVGKAAVNAQKNAAAKAQGDTIAAALSKALGYSVTFEATSISKAAQDAAAAGGAAAKVDTKAQFVFKKDTTVDPSKRVSGGLELQIGDTADKFNKLTVSVGDMHSKALGIGDLSIADQAGAAEAIQSIKDAINTVSSTRGDLGAIQNRLEHTQNNLSVMTENIQDAESTIRDTDVADEMMAYTKNNILIQSAQAMLAQANQVPQGVLQLLQ